MKAIGNPKLLAFVSDGYYKIYTEYEDGIAYDRRDCMRNRGKNQLRSWLVPDINGKLPDHAVAETFTTQGLQNRLVRPSNKDEMVLG